MVQVNCFCCLDIAHSNCITWMIEQCTKILRTQRLCISSFKFPMLIHINSVGMVLSSSSIFMSEGYSELCQSSKMERFAKTQKQKPCISVCSCKNSLLK